MPASPPYRHVLSYSHTKGIRIYILALAPGFSTGSFLVGVVVVAAGDVAAAGVTAAPAVVAGAVVCTAALFISLGNGASGGAFGARRASENCAPVCDVQFN